MHCIIYAAHQRLITPKMHPAKDALEHGCITPMMQLTKDASYQRYNALKMQCTKESSHWRCIAPDIHPTKDIIYQRCTICAARQNYNAPNMNQTVLSLLKRLLIHWDPAIWSHRSNLWPEMPVLWHFWAISDPHGGPGGNFSGSKWPQRTILNVSHPDPTKIHWNPAIWSHRSHLWP